MKCHVVSLVTLSVGPESRVRKVAFPRLKLDREQEAANATSWSLQLIALTLVLDFVSRTSIKFQKLMPNTQLRYNIQE